MRLYSNATLIMAAMLSTLLVFSGCGGEPRIESTPAEKACIEMMQKVPETYEYFYFWNVRALQDDSDLSEIYQFWQERHGLERYGVKVNYLADTAWFTMAKGDYNIKDVRNILAERNYYHDTSYKDTEVWVHETGGEFAFALMEGLFVKGNTRRHMQSGVDDFISVVRGEELSMYDKNAAEVLERLPEGIMTHISRNPRPTGLIVAGTTVEKVEKGTFKWINVYKFESPEAVESADADEYFNGIEDGFKEAESTFAERGEPCPFRAFSLEQEGEFVEWSVLIEELYVISMLFIG